MRTRGEQIDLIRVLLLHVEQTGGSADQLLSRSDHERIPVKGERAQQEAEIVAMLQNAIELTKDPALPLRLGRHSDIGNMGAFGFAVMSCAEVAERLHVSERTLRRRLNGESNSFRALTEEVETALAREYLLNTDLTVSEIAHLLEPGQMEEMTGPGPEGPTMTQRIADE